MKFTYFAKFKAIIYSLNLFIKSKAQSLAVLPR